MKKFYHHKFHFGKHNVKIYYQKEYYMKKDKMNYKKK